MKAKAKTILVLLAALTAGPLVAATATAPGAGVTAIVADRSSVTFVARQMNVPVEGRFGRFSGQISFDPARPEAAKVAMTIDVASIDAGGAEATDAVVGKEWLDAKGFPQARFESTAFKALGGNRYEVSGRLSIKGHAHDVAAPFTFTPQPGGGAFDGAFTFRRADFSVGEGSWADFGTVANDIQVRFHIAAAAK